MSIDVILKILYIYGDINFVMVMPKAMTELLILPDKKYNEITVKGYNFTNDLKSNELTSEKVAKYLIDRFYICPVCETIQRGWALYEEKVDGIILRKFFFTCKHYVTSLAGLQVVDMEYKDMFVIWLHIITTTGIQLIQRGDSIITPFMYYLGSSNASGISGGANSSFLTSIINTSGGVTANVQGLGFGAPLGNTNFGIVVGTGTNPNSSSTYALQSLIPNGTSAGTLSYSASTIGGGGASGNTASFVASRAMANSSGGTITINEVALYAAVVYTGTGAANYFAIARDVLASPISLAKGATVSIYYTFQVTLS